MDRLGPRKFMTMGAIILAIATAACSLTKQIWHFYVLFGVLVSFGICANGYVPNAALVSRWFTRRGGAAFGLISVGFGVAYLMASAVEYMTRQIGWRNSFLAIGLLAIGIAPLTTIFSVLTHEIRACSPMANLGKLPQSKPA